jgi:hypothetical protein
MSCRRVGLGAQNEEIERVVLQVTGVAAVPLDEHAVRARCEDGLPPHKVPRRIHFTAAPPSPQSARLRAARSSAVDAEPR